MFSETCFCAIHFYAILFLCGKFSDHPRTICIKSYTISIPIFILGPFINNKNEYRVNKKSMGKPKVSTYEVRLNLWSGNRQIPNTVKLNWG